jgi:hypothetical protein
MSDNTVVINPAAERSSLLVNNIEINHQPLPGATTLLEVVVTSKENKHETATITTRLESTKVDALKDNRPVAFTYGPARNSNVFYGYTNSVTASKAYQQDGTYDIECFGTTGVLQEGKPRFYTNQTVPQMVADIVKSHSLGVQVDEHSFAFPTYAQTDGTDWAAIVELASFIGCVLYNYRGVVRLVNPLRVLSETAPVIKLIRGETSLDPARQLLEFTPASRSETLASLVTPVFPYFDSTTPALSSPLDANHRLYTDGPILSKEMAEVAEASWTSGTESWTQAAIGRIAGNPNVIPGSVVSVNTGGSGVIDHDFDGLWLVREVQHNISTKSFQTMVALGRPDKVPTNTNTEYKPFWTLSPSGRPQVVRNGDVWESSWKTVSTISSHLYPTLSTTSNTSWKVP